MENKLYYSLCVIAIVALLGFGIYKSGILVPNLSAQAALDKGFVSFAGLKSAHYTADISATNFTDGTNKRHADNLLAVHLDGSRNFPDNVDGFQADYMISASGTPEPDFNFSFGGEVRAVGTTYYVKMNTLDAPDVPSEIEVIKNLWFSINPYDLVKKYGDDAMRASVEDAFGPDAKKKNDEEIKKVSALYVEHPFVVNPKYTGETLRDGNETVRTISFEIDKNALADFIVAFQKHLREKLGLTGVEKVTDIFTKDDVMKVVDDVSFSELTLRVGSSDHVIRSLSAKMHIAVPEDGSSGDVAFTFGVSDINKPVSVKIPDSFLPVDKILEMSMQVAKKKALDTKQKVGATITPSSVSAPNMSSYGPHDASIFGNQAAEEIQQDILQGNYMMAIDQATRSINSGVSGRDLAVGYYLRAEAKFNSGDRTGSIPDYKAAIAADPTYKQSYLDIGVAYLNIGSDPSSNDATVAKYAEMGIAIDPDNSDSPSNADLLKEEIGYYVRIHDYNRLYSIVTQLIAYEPHEHVWYADRAIFVYEPQEQYQKAYDDYTKSIAMEPNDSSVRLYRAAVLSKLGRTEEMCADLSKMDQATIMQAEQQYRSLEASCNYK